MSIHFSTFFNIDIITHKQIRIFNETITEEEFLVDTIF